MTRAFVLIAVVGIMGLSAFLWSGTAHAQYRLPNKPNPCVELRLEIESGTAGPVQEWPRERILLGLFCAHLGDPGPFVPETAVAEIEQPPLNHMQIALVEDQKTQ